MGKSRPVITSSTPGSTRARVVSIERIRAYGWMLRKSLPYAMRGKKRSSPYFAAPVVLARASILGRACPIMRNSLIQALSLRDSLCRERDGIHDLRIAGAAADVPRNRRANFLARRRGIVLEQNLGGQNHCRRAVTALRRARFGKGNLQRVRFAVLGDALDRRQRVPLRLNRQRQTGKHRDTVHQHRTGGTFAELTAVFRAR